MKAIDVVSADEVRSAALLAMIPPRIRPDPICLGGKKQSSEWMSWGIFPLVMQNRNDGAFSYLDQVEMKFN
jgi:hypothetical protein